jgi:DNA-binding IclR family transcriptional regulator
MTNGKKTPEKTKLTSIEKSLLVIDTLKDFSGPVDLSEVSKALGINKSTVHHILRILVKHGYVHQDFDTKKYSLGYKFLEISRTILDRIDVRNIAHDHLVALQEQTGLITNLMILQRDKVIYIDKISPPVAVSLLTYIGFSTEAYATAGGKVLLSGLSKEEILNLYKNIPLIKVGKNTVTDMDLLLKELEKVRIQGYASDDEELTEGIRCLSAPIKAGGKIVAAISVTGSIFTMTHEKMNRDLLGPLMKTAGKISAEMNW